ncbi:uncharacterized protein J3R85_001006 [Psidium guajava]|nr:uncharacterized protein J3R85_001006 [Psidium guajava]
MLRKGHRVATLTGYITESCPLLAVGEGDNPLSTIVPSGTLSLFPCFLLCFRFILMLLLVHMDTAPVLRDCQKCHGEGHGSFWSKFWLKEVNGA